LLRIEALTYLFGAVYEALLDGDIHPSVFTPRDYRNTCI